MDILSTSLLMSISMMPTFIAECKADIHLEVDENKVVFFSASKFTDTLGACWL
jgi:hypothetical protein